MFELRCGVMTYAWGKIGADSEVAKLKASVDPTFKIDPTEKYAELWMGTHPNCPSYAVRKGKEDVALLDWIEANPDSLGQKVKDYFKMKLPFLFKVLSVRTSLSIQTHPNKADAEELFRKRPDLYKDDNHKPELAIALTPFVGLCGFRPITEIADYFQRIEELRNVVGPQLCVKLMTNSRSLTPQTHCEAMRATFSGLIEKEKETVKIELEKLVKKVQAMKKKGEDISPYVGDILLKLHEEFPGDAGAFAIYFLNVVRLQPGEAMFLRARIPHAYLSGDCMECMACSDNVVRAGLTFKYIDKHTLVSMLDYVGYPMNRMKFVGVEDVNDITVTSFHPPDIVDFGVAKYEAPPKVKEFRMAPLQSASISIVIQGKGKASNSTLPDPIELRRGTVFFMAAMQEVTINLADEGMLLFRAYSTI